MESSRMESVNETIGQLHRIFQHFRAECVIELNEYQYRGYPFAVKCVNRLSWCSIYIENGFRYGMSKCRMYYDIFFFFKSLNCKLQSICWRSYKSWCWVDYLQMHTKHSCEMCTNGKLIRNFIIWVPSPSARLLKIYVLWFLREKLSKWHNKLYSANPHSSYTQTHT